ncbi:MAG: hypothetical protein R3F34_13555 [Planctomycetota bacterium]
MRGALAAALLAARRTGRVAWIAIPAAFAASQLATSPTASVVSGDVATAAAAGGVRTAAGVGAAAFAVALALVAHLVHLGRLRGAEADGLLATPVGRGAFTLGTFGGAVATALVALAAAAVVVGATGGSDAPTLRVVRSLEVPGLVLTGRTDARSLVLDAAQLRGATRLRARLVALPGDGPVVFASLAAARAGTDAHDRAEGRVFAQRALEVALPPGDGDVTLTLARLGEGAGLALARDGVVALAPVATDAALPTSLFLHALLAIAAAAAALAALRPFLGGGLCGGTVAAIAFALWTRPELGGAWPVAGLADALDVASSGLVPASPSLGPTVLVCGACLAIATLAPRSVREAGE